MGFAHGCWRKGEEMKEKKKTTAEWLGELSEPRLLEIFREWYIPAIKNKFYDLEERIKKLEKPGKCSSQKEKE